MIYQNEFLKIIGSKEWGLSLLGENTIGEIVGWTMPDRFPPINDRTRKALHALGFVLM